MSRLQELGLVDDQSGDANYVFDSGEFYFRENIPAGTDDGEVFSPHLALKKGFESQKARRECQGLVPKKFFDHRAAQSVKVVIAALMAPDT